METYNWKERLRIGEIGINISKKILETVPKSSYGRVIDVQADPAYRERGVDLLWNHIVNGKLTQTGIEVKTDLWTSGCFCFEVEKIAHQNRRDGCFLNSKAEWWFYIFLNYGVMFVFSHSEALDWFVPREATFRPQNTKSFSNGGKMPPYEAGGRYPEIIEVIRGVKKLVMMPIPTEFLLGEWPNPTPYKKQCPLRLQLPPPPS
jgi:hypothetical protein